MRIFKQLLAYMPFLFAIVMLSIIPTLAYSSAPAQIGVCNLTSNTCISNGTVVTNTTSVSSLKIGKPVEMVIFYAPGCPHCEALRNYISQLNNTYNLKALYINALVNTSTMSRYLNYYKVPKQYWSDVPVLFVGNNYCVGDIQCEQFLGSNIKNYSKTGMAMPVEISGIGKLTILEITVLALSDSVNPCAFAVLILLLSTLFLRDPSRRLQIIAAGFSFAIGIFAFYLTVGILLVLGIKSAMLVSSIRSTYVYAAFGVLMLALGALNVKDSLKYGAGGFVMEVPRRWRPKMAAVIDKIASVPGAFATGIIVTLFLLPCIVGPYFVASGILSSTSTASAIPWLVYYNFIFILPMLIITMAVYMSFTTAEKAASWREKNIRKLHLIGGMLMIFVGFMLISYLFYPL